MIALDTNILVYAHRRDMKQHASALSVVRRVAEGAMRWAIPWQCVREFFRVVTDPRLWESPSTSPEAVEFIEDLLAAPALILLGEQEGYWPILREFLAAGRATGPVVHDAHVVALCRLHGVTEIWSADRDLNRFPGLSVRNPLLA